MKGDLTQQLADRLEHHLNQLCDASACQTAEHDETRELIARARRRVVVTFDPPPAPAPIVVLGDPRAGGWPSGASGVRI